MAAWKAQQGHLLAHQFFANKRPSYGSSDVIDEIRCLSQVGGSTLVWKTCEGHTNVCLWVLLVL